MKIQGLAYIDDLSFLEPVHIAVIIVHALYAVGIYFGLLPIEFLFVGYVVSYFAFLDVFPSSDHRQLWHQSRGTMPLKLFLSSVRLRNYIKFQQPHITWVLSFFRYNIAQAALCCVGMLLTYLSIGQAPFVALWCSCVPIAIIMRASPSHDILAFYCLWAAFLTISIPVIPGICVLAAVLIKLPSVIGAVFFLPLLAPFEWFLIVWGFCWYWWAASHTPWGQLQIQEIRTAIIGAIHGVRVRCSFWQTLPPKAHHKHNWFPAREWYPAFLLLVCPLWFLAPVKWWVVALSALLYRRFPIKYGLFVLWGVIL